VPIASPNIEYQNDTVPTPSVSNSLMTANMAALLGALLSVYMYRPAPDVWSPGLGPVPGLRVSPDWTIQGM
jgi:hypothetical protein